MGTRRPLPLRALALASLLSTACLVPAPARSVHTDVGVVRAATQGSAEYYGDLLAELHPRVRAELPGALDRETELWVQEVLRRWAGEEQQPEAMGFTVLTRDLKPGRIHLRENTLYPSWYLAHELGHALMGPDWNTLPGVLSEGVCDWIAARVVPDLGATIQTHRLLHASVFFGGMSYEVDFRHPESGEQHRTRVWYTYDTSEPVQASDVLRLDRWSFHSQEAVPVSHYGLGYLVVSRIAERHGLEHLHRLCLDARAEGLEVVPTERILRAAGIEAGDAWWPATNDLLGERELREVARLMPAVFRDLPAIAFADRYGELGGDDFLRRVDARIPLADGSSVRLSELSTAPDLGRGPRVATAPAVAPGAPPAGGAADPLAPFTAAPNPR